MGRGLFTLGLILFFPAALAAQGPRGMFDGGRVYPFDAVRSACIEFSGAKIGREAFEARECAVSAFGEIGRVDGITYDYAIYCVIPNYAEPARCGDESFTSQSHDRRGLAIFAREAGGARVVFEYVDREIGTVYIPDPPRLVSHAAGTLLDIPIGIDGSGHINDSQYYVRSNGLWEKLDGETWLKDLGTRLPKDVQTWKGIWPDLKTMRAIVGLYRTDDANCCPTGGQAEVQLGIRGRQFAIEAVTVTPEK